MIILIYEYNEQELVKEGPGFWLSHTQTGFWLQSALTIECVPWAVGLEYEKGLQSKEATGRPIRHPWLQSWESFPLVRETPASTSSSATSIAIDDPVRTNCLQGNVGLKHLLWTPCHRHPLLLRQEGWTFQSWCCQELLSSPESTLQESGVPHCYLRKYSFKEAILETLGGWMQEKDDYIAARHWPSRQAWRSFDQTHLPVPINLGAP